MIEPLALIVLLLLLVTLVGHGIWATAAAFFSAFQPARKGGVADGPSAVLPIAESDPRLARQIAIEEIGRLYLLGAIDADMHARVIGALRGEAPPQARPPQVPPPLPVVDPIASARPISPDAALEETISLDPLDAGAALPMAAPTTAPPPVTIPTPAPPPAPPPPPPAPSRPASQLLAAFMERKNIRWGELVGGLLIVGCSTALTLSFWAEIQQRPLMKFSIFIAVTAALFALGLYSERRWKLPTTSRGILVIALLLVPLNFLAFAAFSRGAPARDPAGLGGEAAAALLFGWLAWLAARTLAPRAPALLAASMMLISVASLAARYLSTIGPAGPGLSASRADWLTSIVVAGYALTGAAVAWRARRWAPIGPEASAETLLLLGAPTFAVASPLALIVALAGGIEAVHRLSAPLSLVGLPAIAVGLLLWMHARATAGVELVHPGNPPAAPPASAPHAPFAAVGAGVAALGICILIGGIAMAWPEPGRLLISAGLAFVLLEAIAWGLRIPALHGPAVVCLGLAEIVGFHLLAGHVGWSAPAPRAVALALLAPSGGSALAPVVLLAATAGLLARRRRRAAVAGATAAGASAAEPGDSSPFVRPRSRLAAARFVLAGARSAFGGAAVVAIASVGLLVAGAARKAGNPDLAAAVFAAYAILIWAIAVQRGVRRPTLWGSAGWTLLAGAIAQELASRGAGAFGWGAGLLAFATVALLVDRLTARLCSKARRVLGKPGGGWSALASIIAAGAIVGGAIATGASPEFSTRGALLAGWLAALWIVAGMARPGALGAVAFNAGQVVAALAAVWGVAGRARAAGADGFQAAAWATAGLAAEALLWSIARRLACASLWRALDRLRRRAGFDAWLTVALAVVIGVTACEAAFAGSVRELRIQGISADPLGTWAVRLTAGWTPWIAWSLLVGAVAFTGRGVVTVRRLLYVGWIDCPLFAAAWADPSAPAAATALRWGAGGYLAAAVAGLWAWRRWGGKSDGETQELEQTPIALAALPLALVSLYWIGAAAQARMPLLTPTGSIFDRLPRALNDLASLAALVVATAALALRQRSAAMGLAALLFGDLLACSAYVVRAGPFPLDGAGPMLFSVALATTGAGAFAWLAAWRRWKPGEASDQPAQTSADRAPPRPLRNAIAVAVLLNIVRLWEPGLTLLYVRWRSPSVEDAASLWGWLAVALPAAGLVELLAAGEGVFWLVPVAASLAALMAGLTAGLIGQPRGWPAAIALDVWMYAQTGVVWLTLGLGWLMRRKAASERAEPIPVLALAPIGSAGQNNSAPPLGETGPISVSPTKPPPFPLGYTSIPRRQPREWIASAGALIQPAALFAAFLTMFALFNDPWSPWPSATVLLFVGLSYAMTAFLAGSRGGFYLAAGAINLAASAVYFFDRSRFGTSFAGLLEINIAALALPSLAWLVLDVHSAPRRGGERGLPIHRFAAVAATGALAGLGVLAAGGGTIGSPALLRAAALAATVGLLLGCLWDPRAIRTPTLLFIVGLAAIGEGLGLVPREGRVAAAALALGGYAIVTVALWWARDRIGRVAGRLGMAAGWSARVGPWIGVACAIVAGLAVGMATWGDFRLTPAWERALAGFVAALGGLAIAATPDWRGWAIGRVGAALAALGAVACAWGAMVPGSDPGGVIHAAVAAVALTVLVGPIVFGRGRAVASRAWTVAGAVELGGLWVLSLAAAVALEGVRRHGVVGGGAIEPVWCVVVLAGALLAGCGVCAAAALAPARGLSAQKRGRWVYGAEAMLAALLAHLALAAPALFVGHVRDFWPLAIMAIAFAGVGLGEALKRADRGELAEPIERTGAFLPLLPALAFWLAPSRVEYHLLLWTAGALYAALAALRRSYVFALLAALAINAGIWSLLSRHADLGFFLHPQLWIIPAALSALAATEVGRRGLSPAQLRAARYACLAAIYLASTADVFLNDAAHSPWLPLALAGLSVAGVLAGIWLRVRAFLFLGSGFLTLAVGAMIYNASASLHVTWIWYVAGILLGLGILTLFALFEKNRPAALALVEGLKTWD